MAWRQLHIWVDDQGVCYQYGLEEFAEPRAKRTALWTQLLGRGQELAPEDALDLLMATPWTPEQRVLWISPSGDDDDVTASPHLPSQRPPE